jgi:hypothetical protein
MTDDFPPTNDIAPTGNSYGYHDEHDVGELVKRLRAQVKVLVGALQECEPFVAHFKGGWCTLTHAQISTDELLETIRAALKRGKKDD